MAAKHNLGCLSTVMQATKYYLVLGCLFHISHLLHLHLVHLVPAQVRQGEALEDAPHVLVSLHRSVIH